VIPVLNILFFKNQDIIIDIGDTAFLPSQVPFLRDNYYSEVRYILLLASFN
jgi:hypothetical protein